MNVTQLSPTRAVWDLGRNFAGFPRLTVRGAAGSVVKLVGGELLDSSGLPSQASSGQPQWYSYSLRGNGTEVWQPRFSFYGFRWVLVSVITNLTGQFVRGDRDPSGAIYWLPPNPVVKHHVVVCVPCPGVDACSEFVTVNQSVVDRLPSGDPFDCSMLPAANVTVVNVEVRIVLFHSRSIHGGSLPSAGRARSPSVRYLCACACVGSFCVQQRQAGTNLLISATSFLTTRHWPAQVGFFNSSIPLFNRIHNIVLESMKVCCSVHPSGL